MLHQVLPYRSRRYLRRKVRQRPDRPEPARGLFRPGHKIRRRFRRHRHPQEHSSPPADRPRPVSAAPGCRRRRRPPLLPIPARTFWRGQHRRADRRALLSGRLCKACRSRRALPVRRSRPATCHRQLPAFLPVLQHLHPHQETRVGCPVNRYPSTPLQAGRTPRRFPVLPASQRLRRPHRIRRHNRCQPAFLQAQLRLLEGLTHCSLPALRVPALPNPIRLGSRRRLPCLRRPRRADPQPLIRLARSLRCCNSLLRSSRQVSAVSLHRSGR